MIAAMEKVAKQAEHLRGKLILTAVMGEEAGGIGSLFLVNQGIHADGAVVGEPTQLEVAIAHKGTYMRRLRFIGRAAHSGSYNLGINAVNHAAYFCVEYEKLNQVLSESPNALLGPGSAAVTIFHGGTRQNTIPGSAEVIIDRRLIPGETHADADRELERVIELVKQTIPELALESIEVIVATIPSQTDPEAFIVETALIASDHVTGITKTARGFNAGCDMSKLVTIAGIPTVIIGPGSLSQAHAPDEFVEISQVEEAVLIYEQIALRFLGR
jgi:acetylornithine deacetylase/succinyl-diaminopimelate desuccinylase-like protein